MNLFQEIETAINEIGHGWTSVTKGQAMAAMIVALRPSVSVEIGVYAGKGLVSMALAHKFVGNGIAIGIDPYSAEASVVSQTNPQDQNFWANQVNYTAMKELCVSSLSKYGVTDRSKLILEKSENAAPIPGIGVLRIDGNHGEPAFHDAVKWAPFVSNGGFVICDDIGWTGGFTIKAAEWLADNGFVRIYNLDDGYVFQRVK